MSVPATRDTVGFPIRYPYPLAPPEISLNHNFASVLPFIGLQIIGPLMVLCIPHVAMLLRRRGKLRGNR